MWRSFPTLLRQLIAKGADIEAKNDFTQTPLHHGALFGRTAVVLQLMAKGAAIGVKDSAGRTALLCAVVTGHTVIAKMLRAGGNTALARQLRQARNPPPLDHVRAALKALQHG